ncbi:hypothetical protein OIO90_003851 [Microbotryomycetes sp. JL221]|nr:hypothetical protein OIO90_003851 [Microbotryomycetes sp. JL221]
MWRASLNAKRYREFLYFFVRNIAALTSMSRSHFSRLGCDASQIIEEWCSSSGPSEKCCGLCPYVSLLNTYLNNSISGNGQLIFNFLTTALTCLSIMLSAEDAWMVSAAQASITAGQNGTIIIMMIVDQRMLNRYQAMLNYMFSTSWIPVMTAVFFSPVWRQSGLNHERIRLLESELAEHKAKRKMKRASNAREAKAASKVRDAVSFDEEEAEILENDIFRHLGIKSAIFGCLWLCFNTLYVWWYATRIWKTGQYEFTEELCETTLEPLQKTLQVMRVWSYVATVLGYILTLMQICCPLFLRKGGSELYLDFVHPSLQRAHRKIFGRAELHGIQDPIETIESIKSDSKLVRETEKVQRWAVFIVFSFWFSGNISILIISIKEFLLSLDDPWTFGQLPLIIYIFLPALGVLKSYRARSDTQMELARLSEKLAKKSVTTSHGSSSQAHLMSGAVAETPLLFGEAMHDHHQGNHMNGLTQTRSRSNSMTTPPVMTQHGFTQANNLVRSLSSTRVTHHQTLLNHRSRSRSGRV